MGSRPDILDNVVVAFRGNGSAKLSGAGGSPTGTATDVGYYDLTTSYQLILDGNNAGTGAYTANDYIVAAKAASITGMNGAKGSQIWFLVRFVDSHANEFFDEVSAGTNAVLSHLRATGSPLVNPIAAPVVAVETEFDD